MAFREANKQRISSLQKNMTSGSELTTETQSGLEKDQKENGDTEKTGH